MAVEKLRRTPMKSHSRAVVAFFYANSRDRSLQSGEGMRVASGEMSSADGGSDDRGYRRVLLGRKRNLGGHV